MCHSPCYSSLTSVIPPRLHLLFLSPLSDRGLQLICIIYSRSAVVCIHVYVYNIQQRRPQGCQQTKRCSQRYCVRFLLLHLHHHLHRLVLFRPLRRLWIFRTGRGAVLMAGRVVVAVAVAVAAAVSFRSFFLFFQKIHS